MNLPATQNMTDGELYNTIQNGIRLTGMPAWGQAVDNDADTWKLAHFIRHLPQLTAEEEREMERLNPKGQEEQEEEQFLNEDRPDSQAPPQPVVGCRAIYKSSTYDREPPSAFGFSVISCCVLSYSLVHCCREKVITWASALRNCAAVLPKSRASTLLVAKRPIRHPRKQESAEAAVPSGKLGRPTALYD